MLDESTTVSGHPKLDALDRPYIDCGPAPRATTTGEFWGPLPLLCPYLSKHPVTSDTDPTTNDGSLNAFHEIGQFVNKQWVWNDVQGYMAKNANDTLDTWKLDLKVPCFKGMCAQDWEGFVHGINPIADPAQYVQDPADEHKIFGCDIYCPCSWRCNLDLGF